MARATTKRRSSAPVRTRAPAAPRAPQRRPPGSGPGGLASSVRLAGVSSADMATSALETALAPTPSVPASAPPSAPEPLPAPEIAEPVRPPGETLQPVVPLVETPEAMAETTATSPPPVLSDIEAPMETGEASEAFEEEPAAVAAVERGEPAVAAEAETPAAVVEEAGPDRIPAVEEGAGSPAAGAPAARAVVPAPAMDAVPQPAASPALPTEAAKAPEEAEPAPIDPKQAIAPAAKAIARRAKRSARHLPTAKAVSSAQAAAISKGTEQRRLAARSTVVGIDAAEPGSVDRTDFKARLKKALEKAVPKPKSAEDAKRIIKSGGGAASQRLRGELGAQQQKAVGPLEQAAATTAKPADQPAPRESKLVPEAAGSRPGAVSPASVVPPKAPVERLDYSADRQASDALMAEHGVTENQLQRADDPDFSATLQARQAAKTNEESAPARYREAEAAKRAQTRAEAGTLIGGGLTGFHTTRTDRLGAVATQQDATKGKSAAQRTRITADIERIKTDTQGAVKAILRKMEDDAGTAFEKGLKKAEDAYDKVFAEVKGGLFTWLSDWAHDISDESRINFAFTQARHRYDAEVAKAIDQVATRVEAALAQAKSRVAEGRKKVDDYVASLDADVRGFGEEARAKIGGDFDAMGKDIERRRDGLIDSLAQKFADSQRRLKDTEKRLREENKGFWARVHDATIGVAKKLIAFKAMLMAALGRAGALVAQIAQDPIGFLGNLIKGLRAGLDGFMANIGAHLKRGLLAWLFGAMQRAGIQLPERFDLKGVFNLIFQVLGLTYPAIRKRAVRIIGEPLVARLEKVADIFKILMTEGLAGLWEMIKDRLVALKDTIIEQVKDWLIAKVIKAGIAWLLSLLNPVAALIKAVKAIYDIIVFFVERAKQVIELVNAIVGSLAAIVAGNLKAMATAVENALAKAIPLAIGLLASLLGLGGISAKVRAIIKAIQQPVGKVVDWLIRKAVQLARKIGRLFKGNKDKATEAEKADPEKQAKIDAGVEAIHARARTRIKNGTIKREDAEEVIDEVRREHRVFKTLDLVDGTDSWDYQYSASNKKDNELAKKPTTIKPSMDGTDQKRLFEGELFDVTDFVNPQGITLLVNPYYISPRDPKGRNNKERAKHNRSPFLKGDLYDEWVELHHRNQDFFGALDEVSQGYHKMASAELHPLTYSPLYTTWRKSYAFVSGSPRTLEKIYKEIIKPRYWKRRFKV